VRSGRFRLYIPRVKPEDAVAINARREMAQLRADLDACDGAHADVDPTIRERFRRWWEERLAGRILDRGERRMRGTQGRN
jgi:hypothetical protein